MFTMSIVREICRMQSLKIFVLHVGVEIDFHLSLFVKKVNGIMDAIVMASIRISLYKTLFLNTDIIQSLIMEEDGSVLGEIVKAKENIKHKYKLLKSDEADVKSLVSQTFEPIIEPLNRLSHNLNENPQNTAKENLQEAVKEKHFIQNIDNWFKSIDFDKTYGPKKLSDGNITLGNKVVNFTQNTLNVEDVAYPLTPGLVRLIFLNHSTMYTEYDLEIYKNILSQTSAHLTLDGSKIKSVGDKYKNIIIKLFPSGGGLSMKLQKHHLVYWNDPNELVDRLRLLLSSQAAGNTGVFNEIISIFEELHEAGIIKNIPNV